MSNLTEAFDSADRYYKLKALFSRPGTPGEKDAAAAALKRHIKKYGIPAPKPKLRTSKGSNQDWRKHWEKWEKQDAEQRAEWDTKWRAGRAKENAEWVRAAKRNPINRIKRWVGNNPLKTAALVVGVGYVAYKLKKKRREAAARRRRAKYRKQQNKQNQKR